MLLRVSLVIDSHRILLVLCLPSVPCKQEQQTQPEAARMQLISFCAMQHLSTALEHGICTVVVKQCLLGLCCSHTQERNSANIEQPVRLMERSVFSDRMVFVRAVNESGWMGDVELAVYDSWFGPILDSNPSLVPDGFIYLRCTPGTCMER